MGAPPGHYYVQTDPFVASEYYHTRHIYAAFHFGRMVLCAMHRNPLVGPPAG
ncbi:MAG: hypothetical protein BMS9Abin29_2126 [Gemmatimonadota bacterium]|nr:MAG: hypothetical protein BMS9Abin29_2126 [Gemmatimonadota bacterium]